MTYEFDKAYRERHWRGSAAGGNRPNPHLARETSELVPGTALNAGCGTGPRRSGSPRAGGG